MHVHCLLIPLTAQRLNFTGSCYVCTLIPHHSDENPTLMPEPLGVTPTICALYVHTLNVHGRAQECDRYLPECCAQEWLHGGWLNPQSFRAETNQTVLRSLHILRTEGVLPFCISLRCDTQSTNLGRAVCDDTLTLKPYGLSPDVSHWLTNNTPLTPHETQTSIPGILRLNVTAFRTHTGSERATLYPTLNIGLPTTTGFGSPNGYLWQCGSKVYLYLPRGWCGTCNLAKIAPASYVFTTTLMSTGQGVRRRRKRELKPAKSFVPFSGTNDHKPLIGDGERVLYSVFPHIGTAFLSTHLNEVWWTLENLTAILDDVTSFLADDPELTALRAMSLQHQMALDLLFAEKGGLCAVVGADHCCTYIPDSRSNWTEIHDRVQDIKGFLKSKETTFSADLLSWFHSGSWWQILLKFLTPALVVLTLFCIFVTCVIPCLRSLVNKMLTNALVVQYQMLHLDELAAV